MSLSKGSNQLERKRAVCNITCYLLKPNSSAPFANLGTSNASTLVRSELKRSCLEGGHSKSKD